MALLLAGYSEQSFILSAFRKLNKHKYVDMVGKVPDYLVPKMGSFAQVYFLLTRCVKCCNSRLALRVIFDKTSEELGDELDILYLVKSLRKMNELIEQSDDESTPQVS